jgi:hypothetical protein
MTARRAVTPPQDNIAEDYFRDADALRRRAANELLSRHFVTLAIIEYSF